MYTLTGSVCAVDIAGLYPKKTILILSVLITTLIARSALAVPVYEVSENAGAGIGMSISAVGTVPSNSDQPFRWYWSYGSRSNINFEKAVSSADITDGSDWKAISSALNSWDIVPGASITSSLREFDGSWGARNGDNEIGWIENGWTSLGGFNLPKNAIAVALSWYNTSTLIQTETDILFNGDNFSWYTNTDGSGSSKAQFVGHIALHELGHAFSLTDLYAPADFGRTMYGYSRSHNEDTTLLSGDMAALEYAYPVPEPMTITFFALAGLALAKRR